MKKIMIIALCAAVSVLCGCEGSSTYGRAVVRWPDGTVREIKVAHWFTDDRQVRIEGEDGKIYRVPVDSVVLIGD